MRYLATYLVYIAVLVRAAGWNQETFPIPTDIWILLAIFGVILFTQEPLTRAYAFYPRLYILLQTGLAIAMLYRAPTIDFLSMLFLPLCFQVVQFFPNWIGFTWIGVIILSSASRMLFGLEWQAGLTAALTSAGMGFLMGSFAYLISRTKMRRQENQRLFSQLQKAYFQLKDSAAQTEALATAAERHRLVRELHDSLTQTLFSMNLAVQSAQLSITEEPRQAHDLLAHLQTLTRSATSEVQALMGRSPHWPLAQQGLQEAIRQLVKERWLQDGLQVNFETSGKRSLSEAVQVNLYRIVQEGLNNVTRHAGVSQALVRLCLDAPRASLEITDQGCGFYPASLGTSHGFGMAGMAERAREIGWDLEVKSQPGQGTYIRLEEKTA